jgi:flagellar hook-associated protein 1 FlgK
MINSFQSLNTITSGLILQQLEQEVIANNLAQPSVDSQGYLMNSLEQVNSASTPSISFTGSNGLISVGTGVSAASITRLRNSFLDNQIQQESSVVGFNSVFYGAGGTGVMSGINSILNGATTINSALSGFTAAWNVLASPATATNVADQNAVVTAGVNFAQAANSQYEQLQNLQSTVTGQMGQTVIQINQILGDLSNINQQILTSPGSNQNSLLDARDYALDKLSQLINFRATFNSSGTVNVWVGDLSLVSSSGASILNVNATNYNNTPQSDVTIQSSQGSVTIPDASALITGGTLGGELNARDVVVQSYMNQLNEVASSVLTMTNNIYSAGYIANTATTGASFFTGTNAATIAVNGVFVNDSTTTIAPYLATEVDPSTILTPFAPTGQLAGFLGNTQNLLAGNYLASSNQVSFGVVDPSQSITSQIGVTATGGTFTINNGAITTITYTAGQSIDFILNQINAISGVNAVFNATTKKFEIFSSAPLSFVGTAGDQFKWANLESILISTVPINNTLSEKDAKVDYGNEALNSNFSIAGPPVTGPNTLAFLVTPSSNGVFSVNGTQVTWNNTETLNTILSTAPFPPTVNPNWSFATQKLQLTNKNVGGGANVNATPIQLVDISGNLTSALWLKDSSTSIGNIASNISTQFSSQAAAAQTAYTSSSASLTQMNNEQDNIAGAAGTYTVNGVTQNVGVSLNTIVQQAYQSMITYNAMLEVMQIIDQTLDALVGISSTTSNGIFQQQTKP